MIEFERATANATNFEMGHADTFKVVPPGIGIVHQVNFNISARGVLDKDGVYYLDTLVGTDSHTTMINGLGWWPGAWAASKPKPECLVTVS